MIRWRTYDDWKLASPEDEIGPEDMDYDDPDRALQEQRDRDLERFDDDYDPDEELDALVEKECGDG